MIRSIFDRLRPAEEREPDVIALVTCKNTELDPSQHNSITFILGEKEPCAPSSNLLLNRRMASTPKD
ncbi:hypothetical protein SKAU_G00307450 [Synaphobranchus kaupii]|uniref:Uncharacterized protein n=1 Tax=Synaphobranchus kaupii TaxID=118154 RepID=A0A9Q1ER16_SYNKA|nr:hypothetical protein SKAU_G00307450 [Synaphobranchus kaupii]